MRGEDATTADIPLFDGTAKSAEGYGFELIWDELRSDGFELHVHWQDGDSSSEKSFDTFFPNGKVMYCGGHVGRAHGKQLETFFKMKTFTPDFMKRHSTSESEYKELEKLKCHCEPRHKDGGHGLPFPGKFIENDRLLSILSDMETTPLDDIPRITIQDSRVWRPTLCTGARVWRKREPVKSRTIHSTDSGKKRKRDQETKTATAAPLTYPPQPLKIGQLVAVAFKKALYVGTVKSVEDKRTAEVDFLSYH
ncbi:Hypp6690 [Branchiostoma lanceolatum]|uniref:Hypp6690 protein n=1 Tax=Branchiostoma lanceolatum TaxID=7740 RepID=A0A8K0EB22_BRALA|nr:Hypp6690 [Branchiostoma lanceolatum]